MRIYVSHLKKGKLLVICKPTNPNGDIGDIQTIFEKGQDLFDVPYEVLYEAADKGFLDIKIEEQESATPEQKKNLEELAEDYIKTVFGEEILEEIKTRE